MTVTPGSNDLQESNFVEIATFTTILPLNKISDVATKVVFKAKRESCEVKKLSFEPSGLKFKYYLDGSEIKVILPNAKQSPDCKLSVESVTVKNETLSDGPMEALQAAYSIEQA